MTKINIAVVVCLYFAIVSAHPQIQPRKIVGGQEAYQGQFPYQISIRYYGNHFCGGSLVNLKGHQVIITAAHCVYTDSPAYLTVIAGDLHRVDNSGLEQTRQVTKIIVHENYDKLDRANDIAVLLIDSPFEINSNVQPIALPEMGQQTTGNVVVSGWGALNYGDTSLPLVLQYVQVPVVDDDICRQAYYNGRILDSMICAGNLVQGGMDSCQGDSGGPLRAVEGGYLAGIVSWGYGCAEPGYPGVYTETSSFIQWLNAQV